VNILNYEVIRPLGQGAMGQVYLAGKRNRLYAIKQSITPYFSEDEELIFNLFQREGELLKEIRHPGLPQYYASFKYNGKVHIVMEYIEGKSLENILTEAVKSIEERNLLLWGIQLCEILFYLHTRRPEPVIYRDLKPANIIITPDNKVRLIDFGVARYYDPRKKRDTMKFGTPGYAAPEQYREMGQSTPRSDIYALGVVLHQLATSYDPSESPFRLPPVRKLRPDISLELEWIIQKAINLNQRDRYLDAGLFMEELKDYYEEKYGFYLSPYTREVAFSMELKTVDKERNYVLTIMSPVLFLSGYLYSIVERSNFFEKMALLFAALNGIVFFLFIHSPLKYYMNPFYFFLIFISFLLSHTIIKATRY